RCRQATKFCSGVVDVRERVPGALGVAGVDQDLHRARSDVKAPRESPEPDQVLYPLALGHERYALGFERPLRECQRDRVRGLEDGYELRRFAGQVMTRGTSPETAGESRRSPS